MPEPSPNSPIPPTTLYADIDAAKSDWDLSKAAGLVLADIAQQTRGLKTTFDSVVSRARELSASSDGNTAAASVGAAQPDAINVSATVSSGTVCATVKIDCVSESVLREVDKRLSKAAQAVFSILAHADHRIECFGTSLDCSISKVADQICDLRPGLKEFDEHLCELIVEVRGLKEVLHAELSCICECTRHFRDCMPLEKVRRCLDYIGAPPQSEPTPAVVGSVELEATSLGPSFSDEPGVAEAESQTVGNPEQEAGADVAPPGSRGRHGRHHHHR